MKPIVTRQLVYTFSIMLLAVLLSACGDNATTSTTADPTATPTQQPTPTQAATPTQQPTPTPTTNTEVTFQQFAGANFTMVYPASWQVSHKSQSFKQSGDNKQQTENIYGFVAQDNISGFHVVRDGDEQAVGGMVNDLLGGQFTCSMGDKSVAPQVTVGGVTWAQADLICMVASNNYEIRELVTDSSRYKQTVIMYGAYQQVGNGAVVPDFAHASDTYFKPMLASFKFN